MKKFILTTALLLSSSLSWAAVVGEVVPDSKNNGSTLKNEEKIKSVMISNVWSGGIINFAVLNITTEKNIFVLKFKSLGDAASVMQAIDQNSVVGLSKLNFDAQVGKTLAAEIMISKKFP